MERRKIEKKGADCDLFGVGEMERVAGVVVGWMRVAGE